MRRATHRRELRSFTRSVTTITRHPTFALSSATVGARNAVISVHFTHAVGKHLVYKALLTVSDKFLCFGITFGVLYNQEMDRKVQPRL